MKFGQDFHLVQVPEWEPFYIDYNLLKKLFKIATREASFPGSPPDFTELYTCFRDNTDVYCAFHSDKYELLRRREAEICKRYGIAPHAPCFPDLHGVDCCELKDLLEAFLEFRKDLVKLQWYNRVNQDAADKIYNKLEGAFGAVTTRSHRFEWIQSQGAWRKQCLKDIERFNALIRDISRVYSRRQSDRSLYLSNICSQQASALVDLNGVYHAIRGDQLSTLSGLLALVGPNSRASNSQSQELLNGLLEFSMTCHARRCAGYLTLAMLPNNGVAVSHNCLNRLITITGRNCTGTRPEASDSESEIVSIPSVTETGTSLFLQMLEHLELSRNEVLRTGDMFGRLPLHYSARYGLTAICHSILNSLQELGQDSSAARGSVFSIDSEGQTPFQYAVIHNHKAVVKLFIDRLAMDYRTIDEAGDKDTRRVLSNALLTALRYQYDDIVRLLASGPIDVNHRSSHGETFLHVSSRIGREDYVMILLDLEPGKDMINIPETVRGWTPLHIACSRGHLAVVKLLLQADASQTIVDHLGWTAKEHAAFRGHLTVARMLEKCKTGDPTCGPAGSHSNAPGGANHHLQTSQTIIVINLGAMNGGRQVTAVDLNYWSPENPQILTGQLQCLLGLAQRSGLTETFQNLYTDTELILEVSAPGSAELMQLPLLNDIISEPFIFPIDSMSEGKLVFKIFRAHPIFGHRGTLVGSGIALLGDRNRGFGAERESLIREHTVPILQAASLSFLGTVTFTYLIAKPYQNQHAPSPSTNHPLKADQVQLVGHRGLGGNNASHRHLQLGENTVESFVSATKLGASFVELDIQLTKDLVPVVYHDFSLSETGTDIPIHDLSLKQFMYASNIQSPRGDPVSVLGDATAKSSADGIGRKPRSRSVTRDQERGAREVQDRMKHTVDFKNKGFKPNTRGDFIQGSFTTLEELLVELPKSIGCNVEIKYPRLHEAVDAGVAPTGIEINTFVDTTLDKIYRFGDGRPLILSSFTPEVCILLAIKQKAYPVMFITNAGKPPLVDLEMRGGSLQVAIHFAKYWGLAGIVLASEALLLCPRLIKLVKNSGLACASYGPLNDIPENAKIQVDAGIGILMSDRVGVIAKTLGDMRPN